MNFACGIVFCFNEEHILADCLEHYLRHGIDLVLVDNHSTDSSVAIANGYRSRASDFPGRLLDIISVKTQGYEWEKILQTACAYMHARLSHYEWILFIDADSFYHSPLTKYSLPEFIRTVARKGYNIIEGSLYEFYPTEKDDPSIISPVQRLRYYKRRDVCSQQKILRYHPSIEIMRSGQLCKREQPRVCSVRFLYFHYPWVSFEHGIKKIFTERKPRYVERRKGPLVYPQYLPLLPIREDLIRKSRDLTFYQARSLDVNPWVFHGLSTIKWANDLAMRVRRAPRLLKKSRHYGKVLWILGRYYKGLVLKIIWRRMGKARGTSRTVLRASPTEGNGLGALLTQRPVAGFWSVRLTEQVQQAPFSNGLPRYYHFLATDFCNVACNFCNQSFSQGSRRSLTLSAFKTMLANLPVTNRAQFTFSGGGEPLLCRDLYEILAHVAENYPWVPTTVRTNGLLIGRQAHRLARAGLNRLEISVHGATTESNARVLQAPETSDLFAGIAALNEELARQKTEIYKVFCPVVSLENIDEVPKLLERAAQLKVQEIALRFAKFYDWQCASPGKHDFKDSLYFHQERYNRAIGEARRAARAFGILLLYEPTFGGKRAYGPCFQPWNTMIIDWDGTIYPCTGGEVWFKKKVAAREYDFGNLLKQHISEFWNNDSFLKLRRTCSRHTDEVLSPECIDCHNTMSFKGPDFEQSHLLRPTP